MSVELLFWVKITVATLLLAALWGWETWQPFRQQRPDRLRHAARNLAVALGNAVILAAVFGTTTVVVADWSERRHLGLLNLLDLTEPWRAVLALLLLDGWMYLWHRANHAVPLLWRFHRMHHTDNQMDVTTATRFHLGEHLGSGLLRLALIPLVGFAVWQLILYDALVIAVTQLHHANVSLGRWDRWLRVLIVTPDVHKVHHSRWQPETDSNFSTVLSVWDRLAGTFRMRSNPGAIHFGLDGWDDPRAQTLPGMLKTPFIQRPDDLATVTLRPPGQARPAA
jgi:sterol desaturase/sphingolipid hydroxylase (fatty acid hydroxylase superfamily)